MTKEEFSELAAAFALGALSSDERAEFERTLSSHPEWTALVDADLGTTTALGAAVPAETPREAVKESLLSRLDTLIDAGERPSAQRVEPPVTNTTADRDAIPDTPPSPSTTASDHTVRARGVRPRRRRFNARILATVTAVVIIAGLGVGVFAALQLQRPAGEVALQEIAQAPDAQSASTTVDGGGQAELTWSANQGTAVLVTEDLGPAPSGHTYEVWFVRGDDKIPAGTFDPETSGETAVLVAGEMHEGDVIAVTVEVTGGSPDGLPSDQLVFTIPTV